MTFNLIDALMENYGSSEAFQPREAESLRELAALAREWAGSGAGEAPLRASLRHWEDFLAATVEDCRRHLAGSEGFDADLVALGHRATAAWAAVQGAVAGLSAAMPRPLEFSRAVARLEADLEVLEAALAALEEWSRAGLPVCPSCGHRSEDEAWCPCCGVALVIPDPQAADEEGDLLQLGPTWTALYQACEAVATGQGSVEDLLCAMAAVDLELAATEGLAAQLGEGEEAEAALRALARAREGLHQMAEFPERREVAALNRGWARMADAAVELRGVLARMEAEVLQEELLEAA